MEITKDIRNELFKRRELEMNLEENSNPNFEDIKKKVSEKFSAKPENVLVLNIENSFGKKLFHISVYIYDSKERLDEIKNLQKTKKQRVEEKKAKEEEAKKDKEAKDSENAPVSSEGSENKEVKQE